MIPRADATTVKHFDLPRMASSAARVFRGTVTDVRPGTVKVGGGQLATTIYRIRVTEALKGDFATFKNVTYADVEMIGGIKAESEASGVRHFRVFRDMPHLVSAARIPPLPDRREQHRALEPGRSRARTVRDRYVDPE